MWHTLNLLQLSNSLIQLNKHLICQVIKLQLVTVQPLKKKSPFVNLC